MRLACFAAAVAACSSPSSSNKDAAIDSSQPLAFQGEYVDWDSGGGSNFCGIFQATYTVHGAGSGTLTPPNGRLMATLPAGTVQIDLTPPTDPAPCGPEEGSGVYTNPGQIVIDPVLVAAGVEYSTRSFTSDRRDAFYTSLGLTYDDTKAQVFVNVVGTASAPQIQASHDATAAYDGSNWGSGATGEYVLFPNVDIVSPATTLTATGYAGSTALPLTAGTITYAAVSN
jgi:hypothetical protein|nr:hypothetical protein [Kofleriaceae bacterium]